MHEAIYMVVGACISGIVGIAISTYTRWRTQIADRNITCQIIEAEINLNQCTIMGLLDTINEWVPEYPNNREAASGLEEMLKLISLFKDIHFQRNAFTGLCDKLGLLKSETTEDILAYYKSIKIVESCMWIGMGMRHGVNSEEYQDFRKLCLEEANETYKEGKKVLGHIKKERTSTKRFYIGRPKDK